MASRRAWSDRWVLVVVLVTAALDLCVAGVAGLAVARSPDVGVPITRGDETCAWRVRLDPGAPSEAACLLALGGVTLAPPSLVREPAYLGTDAEREAWFRDQAALWRVVQSGASVEATVARGDGVTTTVRLPLRPRSWLRILPHAAPGLVTATVCVIIGLFVFYRRPDHSAARGLFVICQAAHFTVVPTLVFSVRGLAIDPDVARWFLDLNFVAAVTGGVSLLHVCATFPRRRLGRHTRLLSLWIPAGVGAAAFLLERLAGTVGAVILCFNLMVLASLVLVLLSQFLPARQVDRLRARWVLWGILVFLLVWICTRIPMTLGVGEEHPSDHLIVLSLIAIPMGFAVAILRHRLLDIDAVVIRTVVGTLLVVAVLFIYNLGVSALASGLAGEGDTVGWFGAAFTVALVITFLVLPVRSRLEEPLERLFFADRRRHRRLLAGLPDELVTLNDPERAAELVLDRVSEAMLPALTIVALVPENGRSTYWAHQRREGAAPLHMPGDAVFWDRVRALEGAYLGAEGEPDGPLEQWVSAQGIDLLLPLRTPVALVGFLAAAFPGRSRMLGGEDVKILRSVAASLALAISHGLAYQTIRRMNTELEQRIRKRTAELERTRHQLYQWEKMASLGVLAAGVAHELNTPLGAILSTADQLRTALSPKGGERPSRSARLAGLCHEAARQATDIVNDLRRFSRPESQDMQQFELDEVLDASLRLLATPLRHKGVTLAEHRGKVPVMAGYPSLVNQAVTNLVLNAAAATGKGGTVTLTTSLALAGGEDRVRIVVQDDGPGVPAEIKNRIFEPFFTTKEPGEGTGLGLSLCYTYVEQHGGRIWEEGAPGEGARFVIELPLEPPAGTRRTTFGPPRET